MGELSPYFIRRIGVPLQPPQPGEPFNEAAEVAGIEPGFWDFWRVIRKHKKLIAMFFVSVVLTVSIGTLLMTPIYTSRTTILIEQKTPTFINIQQAMSESLGTEKHDYYQTQYEILKSPTLAAQVIHELDLKNNKVFTGAGDEGLADKLRTLVKGWLGAQRWARELFSSAKETQVPDASNLSLINHYVNDYLEIKPVESTQLVNITFSTPDRNLSAELANAHTQAYIRQGLKLRTRTNEEAQQFLKQRLVELKDRVKKSEEALNNYRREKGIISLDDKENVVIDRLSDLNKRLTEAEAERIALGAQVKLIHQRTYDSLPAVISNELIQKLKEQLSRLEGEYANLAAEYNLGYPRLAQVKAQLDESRKRLKDEIRGVVQGIESAYLAAESREKGLREKMRQQRNAALKLKDASVEYAILSQEADTNRQLYNSVLQRMKEMGVATEMRTSNVFVVDTAKPALNPSRPKKTLNLLLGAIIGLMGGVALAFLFEYLDNTVRTPDDVENYVHLPTLSVIPDLTIRLKEKYPSHRGLIAGIKGNGWGEAGRAFSKELVLSHHPHSLATESYRSLQTSILLSQAGEPPRTLLFTSGCLGEGKTATAVNIAIVFAQMEAKVLVIDGDLRRSSCHRMLGIDRKPGLTELLTGQRNLHEVIKQTHIENLFLIPSGVTPPDPVKLVGSRKMHELLRSLQEQYDYVFIDAPPVIAVSDATRLSTMVDGVVLVVKGQDTTRDVLREACSRLRYGRATILGVVLNRVNMTNGDYKYYQRDYYRATVSPEAT